MALAFSEFFIIFASVTICSVIFKDGCELLSNLVLRFIIDYLFVSVLKITPNGCEPLGSFFLLFSEDLVIFVLDKFKTV